jgi:hypothetical protein
VLVCGGLLLAVLAFVVRSDPTRSGWTTRRGRLGVAPPHGDRDGRARGHQLRGPAGSIVVLAALSRVVETVPHAQSLGRPVPVAVVAGNGT